MELEIKDGFKINLKEMGENFVKDIFKNVDKKNLDIIKQIIACDDRDILKDVVVKLGDDFIKLPLPLELIDNIALSIVVNKTYTELDEKLGKDWFNIKVLPVFKFLRGVIV